MSTCTEFDLDWLSGKETTLIPKWYKLLPNGPLMAERVGHACITHTDSNKVFWIGGAIPSGTYDEVWSLDLETMESELFCGEGFKPVYEHSAILNGDKVIVFGGADMAGNNNMVQELDITTKKWRVIEEAAGDKPSPRTLHCAGVTAESGNGFFVFGGGEKGSEPVEDTALYMYRVEKSEWEVMEAQGNIPSPRHGHIVAVIGNKIYLHGGMCGTGFYDDLYTYDLVTKIWEKLDMQGQEFPSPRAAHGSVTIGTKLYIFGGLGEDEALNDLWELDTDALTWTNIEVEGPPIPPRLDFAMTLIDIPWPAKEEELEERFQDLELGEGQESPAKQRKKFIMIHGGMNTYGDIFDDYHVMPVPK